jgi:galactose mutarotase-like enzyme
MSASDSNKFILENEFYRVVVASRGAELQSVFSKKLNVEMLWQAESVWPKHAPVLFPIVGALKNNTIDHNGKGLTLSRHGFARDCDFNPVKQSATTLWMELKSDEQTLSVYPFPFRFLQKFELVNDQLQITLEVENTGTEVMYCSYGAHPAFRVPLFESEKFEDYHLKFEPAAHRIRRWPLDQNLIGDIPVGVATPDGQLPLTRELFEADALVMKRPEFTAVSILHATKQYGVRLLCENWPYFGIWSAKGGDFVCLEPWQGIADTVTSSGNLQEKEGILRLEPGEKHATAYSIGAIL